MKTHEESSPLAGMVVNVDFGTGMPQYISGVHPIEVDDWWDKLTGGSWMLAEGNPACLMFAMRMGINDKLCLHNEVLYGHTIGDGPHLGHLFCVDEVLGERGRTELGTKRVALGLPQKEKDKVEDG